MKQLMFRSKYFCSFLHFFLFSFTSAGRTGLPHENPTPHVLRAGAGASTGCRQLYHYATELCGILSCLYKLH